MDKNEIERIGERKLYKGKFKLFSTDNFFRYVEGKLSEDGLFKFGKVNPIVEINEMGTYVGEGTFMVPSHGVSRFIEKQL